MRSTKYTEQTKEATGWRAVLAGALLMAWVWAPIGCGKGAGDRLVARSPKEAASQLEQAFAQSDATVKENALTASEAMRQGEYEKAVVSLEAVRANPSMTLEQGLAVHSSVVSMEHRLIQAMDAGDERARRAYELLRQMKRN